MSDYVGIDYGLGQSNVDLKTGIRYGVISQHTVGQAWYEDAEPDYGKPTCPKCGGKAHSYADYPDRLPISKGDMEGWECDWYEGSPDYLCPECKYLFTSEAAFPDEPLGWTFEDDFYSLQDCLDSDIIVLRSPFYTFAQFCSPCVPGAGNLDNPMKNGVKCYCLGHDWFESDVAPYPVYRIENDQLVPSPKGDPK